MMQLIASSFPSSPRLTMALGKNDSPMNIHDTKEELLVKNADLSHSGFTNVSLQEAQFTDANLSKAKFMDINLTDSMFQNVNLANVEIDDCDVTGMKIQDVLVTELLKAYQERD